MGRSIVASQPKIPGISVVTPTHGRADLVEALLTSLEAAANVYHAGWEILIIDSSSGHEKDQIEKSCQKRRARYHHMENNVRAKRNWGVRHSCFPVVLFVDSDCQADVNLLIEHARAYEQNDSPKRAGVVGLTQFVGRENYAWRVIQHTSTLDVFSAAQYHAVVPWGPTCNISYRRKVLEQVGLFDTSFPFALGGDDTDLGIRVTDAGYQLVTNAHALVNHEKRTWSSMSLMAKRLFRWGRMHFYMMRKHPRRVGYTFPTVLGTFFLLVLLLTPAGLLNPSRLWVATPLVWLCLEVILESLLFSYGQGKQPAEFFYVLGSRILALVFQAGTLLEGIRQASLAPLCQDVSYNLPSAQGRRRGMCQMWAMLLAFPLAILTVLFSQFVSGSM